MTLADRFLRRLSGDLDGLEPKAEPHRSSTLAKADPSQDTPRLARSDIPRALGVMPLLVPSERWPEGLADPLTLGDALDLARDVVPELADELARDVGAMVDALLPAEMRPEALDLPGLAERWPLPSDELAQAGWFVWKLLFPERRVGVLPDGTQALIPDSGWPAGVDPLAVARWARPGLNRLGGDAGPFGDLQIEALEADPSIGDLADVVLQEGDGRRTYLPGSGVARLFLPLSALASARHAWAQMAHLALHDHPTPAHRAAVRAAMAADTSDDLARATLSGDLTDAADRLARELLDHAASLRTTLGMDGDPPADEDAAKESADLASGPVLRWDAQGADFLEGIGETGKALAAKVRTAAGRRWDDLRHPRLEGVSPRPGRLWSWWTDPHPDEPEATRVAATLALALWRDVVRPKMRRLRDKPPAVVAPLYEALTRAQSPGGEVEELEDGTPVLVDRHGAVVTQIGRDAPLPLPVTSLSALTAMIEDGVSMLGSLDAHRLMRWAVAEACRRAAVEDPDFRVLKIEGGWSELAKETGCGTKARKRLPKIVTAMAHLRWHLPDGSYGTLMGYNVRPAKGRRKGRITLTLEPPLLPGYTHDLPRGRRDLVPVLEELPPLIGRPNDHGSQATLQLLVVAELQRNARELVRHGGVRIDAARWSELCDQAGVPRPIRAELLRRWTEPADGEPAFLERTAPDRYTLGESHARARDFIARGGKAKIGGASRRRRRKDAQPDDRIAGPSSPE